ncbi:MAG: hypothetical protein LBJ64_08890 [Deltaproteobacteria bacterium]|nr:hypothetical protein [Deltaproteobacteria bacterium]
MIERLKDYNVRAALHGEGGRHSPQSRRNRARGKSGRPCCLYPLDADLMKSKNLICANHKEVTRLTRYGDRDYKSGFFLEVFSEEEPALELYNALSGKGYPKTTKIQINTLENLMWQGFLNDVSFVLDNRLIILI